MAQTRPSPTLSRGFTRLGRFLAPYAIVAEDEPITMTPKEWARLYDVVERKRRP